MYAQKLANDLKVLLLPLCFLKIAINIKLHRYIGENVSAMLDARYYCSWGKNRSICILFADKSDVVVFSFVRIE